MLEMYAGGQLLGGLHFAALSWEQQTEADRMLGFDAMTVDILD